MADVRGARIVRMFEDPKLTGDLLLVGIAMATHLDFQKKWITMKEVAKWTYGPNDEYAVRKVSNVVREDIRTYRTPRLDSYACQGPMPRAPKCRRSSTWSTTLTDWETGERTILRACSKHRHWFDELHAANRASKPDIVPLPYANFGGVLAPYFPEIHWPKTYRTWDPKWVQHPEPPDRPVLQLLRGDGLGGDGAAVLVLIEP